MRRRILIRCSASLGVLALASAPAFGQTGTQTVPPAPTSQAQTNPAQTDAATQAGNGDDTTIVVTGIRQSLRSAENIRRNSDQIVDSIVAEDIGKLPDISLSDTAARIPGVQVDRGGGEAGRVLVRGLPNFTTSYNGREIFTAETRLVALQDFPSAGIAAVEVFKTSSAELVEPGLAGLVNVRSRRPFDFNGLEVSGSFWMQHSRQSGSWDPNGNILISDRWTTSIGEIGILLNASRTELTYLDSTRSNTDFVARQNIGPGGSEVRFPDIQRVDYGSGDRSRPSINGALQWRPMPGLEFYVEGLWQGFRNKISDREMTIPLWGGSSYTNVVLEPGTNNAHSLTAVNPFRPDGFQGGTFNKTNTYQFAVGGSWDSGPLRISGDLARTSSTFTGSTASVDYALTHPYTIDAIQNVNGNQGPQVRIENFDPANPANYQYRGFYEEAQIAHGDDWQGRLDMQYEPGIDFLNRIEAGVRYVHRDAHREYGNHYWGGDPVLNQNVPFSAVPLDYELFRAGFHGDSYPPFPDSWLAPTYQSIRDNIANMRAFSRTLGDPANLGPPAPFPDQTYDAHEKSYAAYAQLHYAFGSSIRVDGDIGLRAVRTETEIIGTTAIAGVQTPVDLQKNYTDWLPNFSARIRFTDQLQLRLAATKTRTRPDFAQLNPGGSVDAPPSCTPNTTTCIRNLNGGNPYLSPIRSNNYDLALEYYFSRTGAFTASIFRRDINGFIQNYTSFVTDPVYGLVRANRPFNSGSGRIDGFEAQLTTFFDFGGLPNWAHGFGMQANVTYLDAKTGFPTALGGTDATRTRILGVSKWTYNLAGFYDRNGLSLRLSYNYRTHFPSTLQFRGPDVYTEETRGIGRLDFSGSYDLFHNLTLFADWTNILGHPYRTDLTLFFGGNDPATFPRAVRYEETIYSAGVRFRF